MIGLWTTKLGFHNVWEFWCEPNAYHDSRLEDAKCVLGPTTSFSVYSKPHITRFLRP